MKSIIASLVLLLFLTTAFGQDNFKVIRVNGSILLKAKGKSLETGTVFSEKEELLFNTEDAVAAVINPDKGRLILTSKSHDLSTARSNYLPSMYNISTRGGSLLNLIDLQNHFSGKYVVLGTQKTQIERKNFPMNETNFFFLRYIYKGEEINKKLSFWKDTLILDKKTLFTVDGKPIPSPDNTSISLFYRRGSESVEISRFDLIFPDNKQLWKEVSIILDGVKSKSSKDKLGEIRAYMNDFYGKVSSENLVYWLKTEHGISF